MLSNCHDTSMILTGKTDNAGNPERKKTALICTYNQQMGGADCVDQQLHAIHVLRNIISGTKTLLFACFLSAC